MRTLGLLTLFSFIDLFFLRGIQQPVKCSCLFTLRFTSNIPSQQSKVEYMMIIIVNVVIHSASWSLVPSSDKS